MQALTSLPSSEENLPPDQFLDFFKDIDSSETDHKASSMRKRLWGECFSEQQKSFKKLKTTHVNHTSPVLEFSRDEIINVSDVLKGTYYQHIMDKVLNIFEQARNEVSEDELSSIESESSEGEQSLLEEMHQGKARPVMVLGNELLLFCDEQKQKYAVFSKVIKRFVFNLLKKLPPHQCAFTPDPKYLRIAENYNQGHPEKLTEKQIHDIAYRLQIANQIQSCQEDTTGEAYVLRTLGNLLFLCQQNFEVAAKSIQSYLPTSVETILARSENYLKLMLERVQKQAEKHRLAHVQDHEAFLLQKISLEMADHLLLPSGGINFGLIEDLKTHLFPSNIHSTIAAETMRHNLNHLKNPQILMLLDQVQLPKDPFSPSSELIRITLKLHQDEPITKRHVQMVIVSALIKNFRQAKAGTCFVTADIIKKCAEYPFFCVEDYIDLIQDSALKRLIFKEYKSFPFQLTVTKENLSTLLKTDSQGGVLAVIPYTSSYKESDTPKKMTEPLLLWDIPGVASILHSLGLNHLKQSCKGILKMLPKPDFTIDEFIQAAVQYIIQRQTSVALRNKPFLTEALLLNKARYAFSAETQHPFHRAYEQVRASIVTYFGSQYVFARWAFEGIEKTLKPLGKKIPLYQKLLENLFMPMIYRMKYRYNAHLAQTKPLFEGNYGTAAESDYGYQLWDTQLPEDFTFDPAFYKHYHQGYRLIPMIHFEEYAPETEWKCIENDQDFARFLLDTIETTVIRIKEQQPHSDLKAWDHAAKKMMEHIQQPNFTEKLIINFLNRDQEEIRAYKKNEQVYRTTPWKLRWGGCPSTALYANHNLYDFSMELHKFAGSCREVLIYQINYLKKLLKEHPESTNSLMIASPVHAFLLTPQEPTFQKAYLSSLSTEQYVKEGIEKPGQEVSQIILTSPMRQNIIDFLLSNSWYRRANEKHDYERQELASPALFDQIWATQDHHEPLSYEEYRDRLCQALVESRRQDPRIGKANPHWEGKLKSIFAKKMPLLLPYVDFQSSITQEHRALLLDYARHRQDTIALSASEIQEIRQAVANLPEALSAQAFRKALVKCAFEAHCKALGYSPKKWKKMIESLIDNRLLEVLPASAIQKLKQSALITSDTNWTMGIHHIFFAYLVNPGSGELELCDYNKDTKAIYFRPQGEWFPKGKEGRAWEFPGQYRTYASAPIFNFRKIELMDV